MKHMTERYRLLLNTLLRNPDEWEIHSFDINSNHELAYGDATITVRADGMYLVKNYYADPEELLTEYPAEALEMASMEGHR